MANTLLECGAMGRPLITSRIHGCMEAVRDGDNGYLVKEAIDTLKGNGPDDFVELIETLASHMLILGGAVKDFDEELHESPGIYSKWESIG